MASPSPKKLKWLRLPSLCLGRSCFRLSPGSLSLRSQLECQQRGLPKPPCPRPQSLPASWACGVRAPPGCMPQTTERPLTCIAGHPQKCRLRAKAQGGGLSSVCVSSFFMQSELQAHVGWLCCLSDSGVGLLPHRLQAPVGEESEHLQNVREDGTGDETQARYSRSFHPGRASGSISETSVEDRVRPRTFSPRRSPLRPRQGLGCKTRGQRGL